MRATIRESIVRIADVVVAAVQRTGDDVSAVIAGFDRRRRARIEAELDHTQDELRATILRLADALGGEAHEARKALIRESYRASGRLPND